MIGNTVFLLFTLCITGISAAGRGAFAPRDRVSDHLAVFVPQDLKARDTNAAGGWSLALTTGGTCPVTAPACGATWCCPDALACQHTSNEDIGEVCCPSDADCSATFRAEPICGDSSWSLWNATFDTVDKGGYFCCLPGQVGLQTGVCVASANAATAGPIAIELAPATGSSQSPAPTLSVSTVSISGGASTATSVTTTTASSAEVVTSTKTTAASTTVTPSSVVSVSSGATDVASSVSKTSVVTSTTTSASSITSSSAPTSTSLAAVTGKSGAHSSNNVQGAFGGGLVAAVFAFALL